MATNFKALYARRTAEIKRLQRDYPDINICGDSGIYIYTRRNEESGTMDCYVGQARNMAQRLADHEIQHALHIDNSLDKHGHYNEQTNPNGWKIAVVYIGVGDLDRWEQFYIEKYRNIGYNLYNITGGGQGVGKFYIAPTKERCDIKWKKVGYEKARKQVAKLFELHLDYVIKGKETAVKQRAKAKFEEFLKGENNDNV